jgi:ABC-type uncharacterized transport system substrate-binding protein
MDRRAFVSTVALGLLAGPLAREAQSAEKVARIGVLVPAEPATPDEPNIAAFRQRLRDLGYVDGQNIAVEYRYAHGKAEIHTELVVQLVRLKVDVMVVGSTPAALAAKRVTETTPTVFVGVANPVESGIVTSLGRPGGNATGLSFAFDQGFSAKWVELLKEAVPNVSRIAVLRNPDNPASGLYLNHMQTAARVLAAPRGAGSRSDPRQLRGNGHGARRCPDR